MNYLIFFWIIGFTGLELNFCVTAHHHDDEDLAEVSVIKRNRNNGKLDPETLEVIKSAVERSFEEFFKTTDMPKEYYTPDFSKESEFFKNIGKIRDQTVNKKDFKGKSLNQEIKLTTQEEETPKINDTIQKNQQKSNEASTIRNVQLNNSLEYNKLDSVTLANSNNLTAVVTEISVQETKDNGQIIKRKPTKEELQKITDVLLSSNNTNEDLIPSSASQNKTDTEDLVMILKPSAENTEDDDSESPPNNWNNEEIEDEDMETILKDYNDGVNVNGEISSPSSSTETTPDDEDYRIFHTERKNFSNVQEVKILISETEGDFFDQDEEPFDLMKPYIIKNNTETIRKENDTLLLETSTMKVTTSTSEIPVTFSSTEKKLVEKSTTTTTEVPRTSSTTEKIVWTVLDKKKDHLPNSLEKFAVIPKENESTTTVTEVPLSNTEAAETSAVLPTVSANFSVNSTVLATPSAAPILETTSSFSTTTETPSSIAPITETSSSSSVVNLTPETSTAKSLPSSPKTATTKIASIFDAYESDISPRDVEQLFNDKIEEYDDDDSEDDEEENKGKITTAKEVNLIVDLVEDPLKQLWTSLNDALVGHNETFDTRILNNTAKFTISIIHPQSAGIYIIPSSASVKEFTNGVNITWNIRQIDGRFSMNNTICLKLLETEKFYIIREIKSYLYDFEKSALVEQKLQVAISPPNPEMSEFAEDRSRVIIMRDRTVFIFSNVDFLLKNNSEDVRISKHKVEKHYELIAAIVLFLSVFGTTFYFMAIKTCDFIKIRRNNNNNVGFGGASYC